MVAHDVEGVGGDLGLGDSQTVAELLGDVGFVDGLAVEADFAVEDFDRVAGDADDALDVRLRGVAREPEDDGVAAFDFAEAEAVDEFVDENSLLVFERGHHGGPFHLHWLVKKEDDDDGDDDREHEVAQPVGGTEDEVFGLWGLVRRHVFLLR